jgi:hypothetical protein
MSILSIGTVKATRQNPEPPKFGRLSRAADCAARLPCKRRARRASMAVAEPQPPLQPRGTPRRETAAEREKRAQKKKKKKKRQQGSAGGQQQEPRGAAGPGCAAAAAAAAPSAAGRSDRPQKTFGLQRIEQVKDGLPIPGTGLQLCRCGQLDALRARVDARSWHPATTDRYGSTALMWAAGSGHVAVASWLVETHGAAVDAQNKDGRSALMWAIRNAELPMCDWLVDRHGAALDAVNKSGTNLLHWAIWSGSIQAVEWVLGRGAFAVDYRNYLGCSAAHWSATQGDPALCRYFARRGVRFDAANKAGHTGVHKAAWYGKREVMR